MCVCKECCKDFLDDIQFTSSTFGYCQVGPGSFISLPYVSRSDLVLYILSLKILKCKKIYIFILFLVKTKISSDERFIYLTFHVFVYI